MSLRSLEAPDRFELTDPDPMPIFRHETEIPFSQSTVWDWHMRPGALERLMPPWEDVRLIKREGEISEGGTVHLTVGRGPIRLNWHLRHTEFDDGNQFRNEQISGPLGRWIHTHAFRPGPNGGCIVGNEVDWEPPLGSMASYFTRSTVESELRRLFVFQRQRLIHDLGRHKSVSSRSLRVAITGSGGLVGAALSQFLTTGGHSVYPIVRRVADPEAREIAWDPLEGKIDAEALNGLDAVVHLAGESIAEGRWSKDKKRAIWRSRIEGTRVLVGGLNSIRTPPRVFVSSSAVGYYGNRNNEYLTEASKPGEGFLADLCREWETEAGRASRSGIRVICVRTGMVLSPAGGALGTMLLPFKMGVGGRLGSGKQYVSWIDHDDLIGILHHAICTKALRGPLNATAPHPVTNATFTTVLGRVLHRPTLIPVPSLAVKALFGEMGQALLLEGQRVVPKVLAETGFNFIFEGLEDSLRFQLGRTEG